MITLTKEQTFEAFYNIFKSQAIKDRHRYKFHTKFQFLCLSCLRPTYISYNNDGLYVVFCKQCANRYVDKPTIVQVQYLKRIKEEQLRLVEKLMSNDRGFNQFHNEYIQDNLFFEEIMKDFVENKEQFYVVGENFGQNIEIQRKVTEEIEVIDFEEDITRKGFNFKKKIVDVVIDPEKPHPYKRERKKVEKKEKVKKSRKKIIDFDEDFDECAQITTL